MASELLVSRAYLVLLGLAVIATVVTAVASWRYHERPGGRSFAALTATVSLWALGDLMGHLSSTTAQAMVAQRFTYLAISLAPVAWVALAFTYVGRSSAVTGRRVVLLCLVPAATLVVSLTNGEHHLLWEVHGITRVGAMTTLDATGGPWFWVHALYSYGLLFVGSGVLLSWALQAREAYRAQITAVLLAVTLPWAANVVYVTGLVTLPADVTPLAFTATCVVLWVGLFHYRFLDVIPVARNRVVEEMREGVVVVDGNDRIVDANPAAKRLLRPDRIVGRHIESVFTERSVDRFGDVTEGGGRLAVEYGDERRHFDVRISPLSTSGGDRVVIFHDVTAQERHRERLAEQTRELERQNERLDRFASVLSHDLRNPLSVARGWTEVLAEDDVNRDALERVRRAHTRIDAIVDDTLALARSGTDPDVEPVALDSLARRAWRAVEPGGDLVLETDAVVLADPDRTQRLFENLFRNAAEHGGDGVTVTVGDRTGAPGGDQVGGDRARDDEADGEGGDDSVAVGGDVDGTCGFYVADDGPGIDDADLDRAFEYGYSGDGGGTGLGLAIVRDVSEAHGWSVALGRSASGGAQVTVDGVAIAKANRKTTSGTLK